MAPMAVPRRSCAVAVISDQMFVIGGCGKRFEAKARAGKEILNTVEIYDPVRNCWMETTGMSSQRQGAAAVTLRGLLYVVGGYNGSKFGNNGILNSVEVYDPATSRWQGAPAMKHRRQEPVAAELNGKLYVAGGWDGSNRLSSVECFDYTTATWSQVSTPLQYGRTSAAAAVSDGMLYILGGRVTQQSNTDMVEIIGTVAVDGSEELHHDAAPAYLPPGWKEHQDFSSGKTYYESPNGTVTWELPR